MLRKFLLIIALLACVQQPAEGGRVPLAVASKTGVESTASSLRASRVVPAPVTDEGSAVVVTRVELERKSGRTSKSLRHEVPPHGGGSFERQARRDLPPTTRPRVKSRQSAHKSEKDHNPQEESDRGNKSVKKSPLTLTSITEERNASIAPEYNLLDAPKTKKTTSRAKLSRSALKDSRRFRRRRITKEQREFWDRLDQRNVTQSMAGAGHNHTEGYREASNSSSLPSSARRIGAGVGKPSDGEIGGTLLPLLEEFPFLSDSYDYNDYYYDDESILALTNSSSPALGELNKTESSTVSISSRREFSQAEDIRANQTTTEEEKRTSAATTPATNEKVSIASESSKKIPNVNFTVLSESSNTSTISLSKLLSDNLISLPRLQGRIMPNLEADETKQVHLFSVAPSTAPMTAIDSFRSRRQHEGNRDQSAPRDILKEFPIFRQFVKNEQVNEKRHLSLHERLQSRRLSTEQPDLESSTQSSVTSTTLRIIAIVSQSQPPPLAPTATASSTTSSKPTASTHEERLPLKTASRNSTQSRALNLSENKDTVQPLNQRVEAQNLKTSIKELSDSPSQLTRDNKTSSTNDPQPESVLKNVTFSTSKTHTEAATSPLDVLGPVKLESQLGIAPLGETPFGLRPFGEIPMGETPFGLSPEGVAPLGNLTSMESLTGNETESQDGLDGRYHVQVTAPDGSINGDYIVVDPVTGDVNGVRYEAAHDVDPLLVQRALLNFLSLDPRLRPAEEDVVSTTEAQLSKSENTTPGASKTENVTSVVEISEPTEPPELLKIAA